MFSCTVFVLLILQNPLSEVLLIDETFNLIDFKSFKAKKIMIFILVEIMTTVYQWLNYWMSQFECNSHQQLYTILQVIAITKLGLDEVPFSLLDLAHPPSVHAIKEIRAFLLQCHKAASGNNSDDDAIKLIKYLKDNPPEESYENPYVSDSQPTEDEWNLIHHIFNFGIDLPGSKHNLFGHLQYFSSFFIDMFFGNYTEFDDHIKTLPKEKLEKAIKKREGYCQYSPIFAPIIGLEMVDIEIRAWFTSEQVQEIRTMYSGCNEHKHLKIMNELIRLGADVNAHDIYGFTPLHYAVLHRYEGMVTVLLEHGANPNSESRIGYTPLSILRYQTSESGMKCINILFQQNARLTNKKDINDLRTTVETNGTKDLAIRVREAHPRDKEECEKCSKPTTKKCGACGKVYYCTPACQKLDWMFHKITCQKKKEKQRNVDVD